VVEGEAVRLESNSREWDSKALKTGVLRYRAGKMDNLDKRWTTQENAFWRDGANLKLAKIGSFIRPTRRVCVLAHDSACWRLCGCAGGCALLARCICCGVCVLLLACERSAALRGIV